ncbi:TIGR02270 family protein [Marinimicrobium agarilyticum]|uniref:TIGR02270 family protein n=1 Tax=Marinimicrobium agarilyticum TaxID=306546 RepID=UPI000407DA1A|nr:TIGR02270 family protein [Marinimicrobium agarilyticum]
MTAAIKHISAPDLGFESQFDDYVDESAFLWLLRSRALSQPHYSPHDLAELESRIDGQLLALSMAPESAWRSCQKALLQNEPGEVFTASVVAFQSLDVNRIQRAVEAATDTPTGVSALVSALAWMPGRYCHEWLKRFLTSKELAHKRLALSACIARGEDPCDYLTRILRREDCRANETLYAEAVKAAGVFKRRDLSPFIAEAREAEQSAVLFAAHEAAILLGDRRAALGLTPLALEPGRFQLAALDLGARVLPTAEAKRWISIVHQKADVSEGPRLAIKASAALGDPEAIPWLLGCMKSAELARLAGEAFYQITGIHLEDQELCHRLPQLPRDASEDEPDTPVPSPDEDEHLPWPNSEKVTMLWQTVKHRFEGGQRYLLGRPVSAEHARGVFQNGYQRQRRAAGLEWALLEPACPLPSLEQRQEVL